MATRSRLVMRVDGCLYAVRLTDDGNLYFAPATLMHMRGFVNGNGDGQPMTVLQTENPVLIQLIKPNGDALYPLQEHEDELRNLISVYTKIPLIPPDEN